jgi:hypothetical protein
LRLDGFNLILLPGQPLPRLTNLQGRFAHLARGSLDILS